MPSTQPIATLTEITGREPKRFGFQWNGKDVEGIVLEFKGRIRAFRNMCMHEATPLDVGSGEFWNGGRTQLRCKRHGATFDPVTGACTGGPCPDTFLKKLPIRVDGESVYLDY